MELYSMTVYLVACAAGKLDVPSPAKDLYVSDLFSKSRAYVESRLGPDDSWFILSAKHGLLNPEDITDPYDLSLNSMKAADRRLWAKDVIAQFAGHLVSRDVVILAGKKYRERIEPSLRECGVAVSVPMEGLGIGSQLQFLKRNASPKPLNRGESCRNCESSSHANCCARCGRIMLKPGEFCGDDCCDDQSRDDGASANEVKGDL
jgi:hypothetical protein